MLEIDLAGERVGLLPQKALWWPAQKTLVIADVHWGKGGHFRKHGIALPMRTGQANETRLAALVADFGAARLVIAGDLFHSADNAEVENFTHWRRSHASLHIDFVMGNHDILPRERYAGWNLMLHEQTLSIAPFLIAHDCVESDAFVIHGHIHPGVRVGGRGRAGVAVSCFAADKRRMILPAFGAFTGNYYLRPEDFGRMYAVGEEEVIELKF